MQVGPWVVSFLRTRQVRPALGYTSIYRKCHSSTPDGCCYAMSGMEGGVIEKTTLPGLTPRYVGKHDLARV